MNSLCRRQWRLLLPKADDLLSDQLNARFLQQQTPSSNIARRLLAACIVFVHILVSELQFVCLHHCFIKAKVLRCCRALSIHCADESSVSSAA